MSNIKVGEVGHTGTVSGKPGNHLHYQLMGNLPGIGETNVNWNMLNERRKFFLNKFGATDSYYANGNYKNYYYDINNIQARLGL